MVAPWSVTAVGLGAALGAWLRWGLSLWLNPLNTAIPGGTLTCNLVGGYLIGIAVGFFASNPQLSPAWRLFAVTGFLGGLTTFSTFSAESMALLQRGNYALVLGHSLLHLIGSVTLCVAGLATWRLLAAP